MVPAMKTIIVLSIFIFTIKSFAADRCEQQCYQTNTCEEITAKCSISRTNDDPNESGPGAIAHFRKRINIQHGCATNSGVQYIWEQGMDYGYRTEWFFAKTQEEANANALKDCRKTVAEIKNSIRACH